MIYYKNTWKKPFIKMYIQEEKTMAKEKVVLAYSGGLDTSVIMTWLKAQYH